jgi:PPM family protein phosphatase
MTKNRQFTAQTDTGKVRDHNEDRYYIHAPSGFIAVADGMGGHNAGEVASRMAVDVLRAWLQTPDTRTQIQRQPDEPEAFAVLRHLVAQVNRQIYVTARQNRAQTGMGTTLLAAWIDESEHLHFAHVGDSRLYVLREGTLRQLTTDHSLVQELVDAGTLTPDAAKNDPRRYAIRRAVGIAPTVAVDLGRFSLQPGDILLACTDGLTDMVDDAVIRDLIADNATDLEKACAALIRRALAGGGEDNVTVVLVRVS